jgi:hypothetical protein
MKKSMLISSLATLMAIFFAFCSNDPVMPNDPDTPDNPTNPVVWEKFVPQANLSLIKANGLAKGSAVASGEDIIFGEILATKKMSYILMNTGNLDLFDIWLSASEVEVFPETVGVLQLPEGGLLSAPVIAVTVPHVIPSSGVGSLLDMKIGEFVDTLRLSYKYEVVPFDHAILSESQIVALMDSIIATSDTTADTVWVYGDTLNVADVKKDTVQNQLSYTIGGTRMGVIVDLKIADKETILPGLVSSISNDELGRPRINMDLATTSIYDSLTASNNGNLPIAVKIWSKKTTGDLFQTTLDTTMVPGSEMNFGAIFKTTRQEITDSTTSTTVLHYIDFGPSQGVIKTLNMLYTGGCVSIMLPVRYKK